MSDVGTKDFNGVSLFNGNSLNVTVDSEANLYQMTGVDLGNATYTTLASDSITNLTGPNSATKALGDVKAAINQLAADRASLGAHIETLTMYSDQLGTLKNNLASANSRIMDVDVAQESTAYAKYNILVQSGTAMLAQANALPQSVLKLLQ
jgi:flagellin